MTDSAAAPAPPGPAPAPGLATGLATAPLRLYISWGQAGIMIAFGSGLVFCAVLLGVTAWSLRTGVVMRASLVALIVFLVWSGLGYVLNALAMRRRPVFELHADRLVCHDLEGTYEVALGAIDRVSLDERRGIAALVVEAGGRRIMIPASLTDADAAFERLQAAADGAENGTAAGGAPEGSEASGGARHE